MKKFLWRPRPARFGQPSRYRFSTTWLVILVLGILLEVCACGQLKPQPDTFEPQAYKPIEYQELLLPGAAGLHAGDRVRVKAYFWQFVDYDPAMIRSYLTLFKYPIQWYRLRWFAVYRTDELTGYYDLAAMTPEVANRYKLQRLDPVMLYGELSQLGTGLFFQVFYIEKISED